MSHPSPETIALLLVWLGFTGGAVGSFLNVVVYRVPAGMSLLHPGSHCPLCGHPVRWYDNLPVLGWILLGGRCRDCHAPIALRYPLIEALTMAIFVAVVVFQWIVPGGGLPLRSYPVPGGYVTPELGPSEAVGICAYHLFLLCTLLSATLIEYDGKRLPWRVGLPALVVGVVGGCLWPNLHSLPAIPSLDGWLAGVADGLLGLTAGLLGGMSGWLAVAPQARRGSLMASALTGLFLGWQAVAVLTLACIAIHVIWSSLRRLLPSLVHLPPTAWWTCGSMAWIVAGAWVVKC